MKMYVLLIIATVLLVVAHGRPQLSQYSQSESFGLLPAKNQRQSTFSELIAGGGEYLPPATTTPEPIISKQFYFHSAPETAETTKTKHFVLGRSQKNYRVVFIKAPESEKVRYTAEYAPREEKTVIYVLSQKEQELNLDDVAVPEATKPSKPEVFFIKYETKEEAAAAQQQIQDQYDQLGGSSEFSDQGIAPVSSVIGIGKSNAPGGGYDYKPANIDQSDQSGKPTNILSPPLSKN